jgi:hypothetical protein
MSYNNQMRSEYNQGESVSISRPSSDAYLVIDSADRGTSSALIPGSGYTLPQTQPFNDFRLQRPQNLLQGGFTGLSLTEVRFPYAIPNIITGVNDTFYVKLQNPVSGTGVQLITIPGGFWDAQTLADNIESALVASPTIGIASSSVVTWTVTTNQNALSSFARAGFDIEALDATLAEVPFAIYPVNPALMTLGANGVPTATTVLIPEKGLMTLMGFDYPSDWNYWCSYFNGFIRSNFAPMTYTTYIDICSDKLTQYQKVRDSSSKTNARNNVICRLFIADENSVVPTQNFYYDTSAPPTRVAYSSYLAPGSVPFIIHRQFQYPKIFRWNKEVAIDWIDIKLYDDGGNLLPLPFGGLPDFQITFKASED